MPAQFSFAKFTPERQEKYLGCIAQGMRHGDAARSAGVGRHIVQAYLKTHPDFQKARDEAEVLACEIVEGYLLEACKNMNMTGIIFWLTNRAPDRWKDRRFYAGQTNHQTDDATLKAILERLTQKEPPKEAT